MHRADFDLCGALRNPLQRNDNSVLDNSIELFLKSSNYIIHY